jgi:hypothetical protein
MVWCVVAKRGPPGLPVVDVNDGCRVGEEQYAGGELEEVAAKTEGDRRWPMMVAIVRRRVMMMR